VDGSGVWRELRPADRRTSGPWEPDQPVLLPGTDIKIRGSIDRLDLRASAIAVRVADYKTGQRPKSPEDISVAGGAELQRVLYSLACRQLLPDTKQCPEATAKSMLPSDRP
jgi:RecB family exonuclease